MTKPKAKPWKWVKVRDIGGDRTSRAIQLPNGSLWGFFPVEDVEVIRGRVNLYEPEQREITMFPVLLGLLQQIHDDLEKPKPASPRKMRSWIRNVLAKVGE